MTDQTATVYNQFHSIMRRLEKLLGGITVALLPFVGVGLGAMCWYLMWVQAEHHGGWWVGIIILAILSVIGLFCSFIEWGDEVRRDFFTWSMTNFVVGVIMAAFTGLVFLSCGRAYPIYDGLHFDPERGVIYTEGDMVPRNYLEREPLVELRQERRFYTTTETEYPVPGEDYTVYIRYQADFVIRLEDNEALRAEAARLHEAGVRNINTLLWQGVGDAAAAIDRQIEGADRDSIIADHTQFPAPHPWLSPFMVTDISRNASLVGVSTARPRMPAR